MSFVTSPLIAILEAISSSRSSLRLLPNELASFRVISPVVFTCSVSAPLAIALFSTWLKSSVWLPPLPRYTFTVDVTPSSFVTLPLFAVIKASTFSI